MVGRMGDQREGAPAALALAGLIISLACCMVFAFALVALGSICFSDFMGEPPSRERMQIGAALFIGCAIVVILVIRAHLLAGRFLIGRGDAISTPTMLSGLLSAMSGAGIAANILAIASNGMFAAAYVLGALLDVAVFATWIHVSR